MVVLLRHWSVNTVISVFAFCFICNISVFSQSGTTNQAEETLDELLLDQKYETALEMVTEKLLVSENYDPSSAQILEDFNTAIYLFVVLKKTDEGEYLAEKMRLQYESHFPGINYLKGIMECHNDNYGNAEKSFVREINMCRVHVENLQSKESASVDEYAIAFQNIYVALQKKVLVTALRGKKEELQDDLRNLEAIRYTCEKIFTESTNLEMPDYIAAKSPGIIILEKFSKTVDDPDVVFYRVNVPLLPPVRSGNMVRVSIDPVWGTSLYPMSLFSPCSSPRKYGIKQPVNSRRFWLLPKCKL